MNKLLALLLFIAACARGSERPADLQRTWQGIPGLERSAKGRVFVSWFSGGPKEPAPENEVYLSQSEDGGKTFTPQRVMADPKDGTRCFDPTLWIDSKGRLCRGGQKYLRRDGAEAGDQQARQAEAATPGPGCSRWRKMRLVPPPLLSPRH